LALTGLHPGVTAEEARAATAWPLKSADSLAACAPPTAVELTALRALKLATDADGAA
jgi:glutaconate CoA-transferase subunit B